MMSEDAELLNTFAGTGSQQAFTALVTRYGDMVYAAALRQVDGDSGLAEEVAQGVFLDLARKAATLPQEVALAAWLHRATRLAALQARRARQRRFHREREAARMHEETSEPVESKAPDLTEVIDEALDRLSDRDRELVLLRFFQRQNFPEIGARLNLSQDAARMRLDRALEKLRDWLAKRGIQSTAAALSAALMAQGAAVAAPAGFSILVAQAALALPVAAQTTLQTALIMASMKFKMGVTAAVAAGAIALATREHFLARDLQAEVARLKSELAAATSEHAVNTPAAGANDSADAGELARLRAAHAELLRLRGEAGLMRAAKQEAERLLAQERARAAEAEEKEEPIDAEAEAAKSLMLARMNYAQGWGTALLSYAEKNDGRMPATLAGASEHFPPEWASMMAAFDADKFEIAYRGSLQQLANPERTIIVREKEAFWEPKKKSYLRTYLFADGHTELHSSPDGDFQAWERERMVRKTN